MDKRMKSVSVRWALLFAFALATLAAPTAAQDMTGAWDVRWAQSVRVNENGSMEILRWGDAELSLVQDGTRVTGTWTTHVLGTVSWKVSGSVQDGHLALVATEHDSDEPQLDRIEQLVWEGTASGDTMEGTLAMQFRGRERPPIAPPFTATRVPNPGSADSMDPDGPGP